MDTATKSREQKLRRQAARLGKRVKKSRADGTYTLHPLVDDGEAHASWVMTLFQLEGLLAYQLAPNVEITKTPEEIELEAAWERQRAAEAAWDAKLREHFSEAMDEAFANPVPMPELDAAFNRFFTPKPPVSTQPSTIVQVDADGTVHSHTNPDVSAVEPKITVEYTDPYA